MAKRVSFSLGKIIAPLLVFIFLFMSILWAGTTGKIAGRVLDQSTGEGLAGANVVIIGTTMGASTDQDGFFFIINVRPDVYSVLASYIGYETITQAQVKVSVDLTTDLNYFLTPTTIIGAEVTVVAERPVVEKNLTASEQVVGANEISRSWARTIPEIMETKTGVFDGLFRGGSQVESTYLIDNVSLNSGLVSDNYSSLNTSTIQEIAILTGGYKAEYGNVRSAVINVITKERTTPGIQGTIITRMRPSGKYHYGRNIYSQENYDWTHYDLDYWTEQSQDPNSEFSGENANELLQRWQQQINPGDTLGNYHERAEYETEATLYGMLTNKLGFLVSGRYKRGVNIFPQANPYNPEFNIQAKLNYRISRSMKLVFSTIYGGWETSERRRDTNFNSLESAMEADWYNPMQITDPYSENKYRPYGAFLQWPELKKVSQFSLSLNHVLSLNTFYEISASYLHDSMDRSDRNGMIPDNLWSATDDVKKMVPYFYDKRYHHVFDKTDAKVISIKGDLTSQLYSNHLVKTGLEFKMYDFWYKHLMGYYEGGSRWNLNSVFDGKPYEGSLYMQDKIEFSGLIVNAGIRMDFFQMNSNAPKLMFDPLAMQPTTPGHDPDEPMGIPGTPERERTALQYAISPRVGISHPISENTVLHFNYGHFYQRPSWTKMFGLAFINFSTDPNIDVVLDPYAKQTTYLDQWQGYQGNPEMGYERTIQYEIGIDQNIANVLRLDITGYYKDATYITGGGWDGGTHVIPALNFYNVGIMTVNDGYSDVRGLETELKTLLAFPLNLGVSHDVYWSWDGRVGYSDLYEPGSGILDVPIGYRNNKGAWSNFHKIKAWANFYMQPGRGPGIAGVKPLSDVNVYLFFRWRSGQLYTYHGPGDVSTKPNNMKWFPIYETNLKVAKGFHLMGVRSELSVEVRNLFDNKFYSLLGGENMIKWQENKDKDDVDRLPIHWFSNEPNEWGWYSYETTPRQIYFQLQFTF